mmetsp:Transcript_1366/g.2045  ORF Transcript_1366/g.2045 Transcript_1366/m.2045 type:complete len:506 (+) Transcript_1366:21-1538(+)
MDKVPPNIPEFVESLPDTIPEGVKILKNYINGKFVDHKGKFIVNRNPANNEILSYVPASTKETVEEAANSAKEANEKRIWSSLTAAERSQYLNAIADKVKERFEEFVECESNDTGKPRGLARMVDIDRVIKNFKFFAGAILHDETGCHSMGDGAINYTIRQPIGVCGLITPWNLPLYLHSWKVAPALACGNCVVAKASELTPESADMLAHVIDELKIPAGVYNLVHGYGRDVGAAIVEHKDIPCISFTGGTATGAIVGANASKRFKKVSLELGGKNSMVVFDDADLNIAVAMAKKAGFANQGQVCLCCSRLFVHDKIYDAFLAKFKLTMKEQVKIGNPSDPSTNFGTVISLAHREKIKYYVNLAKEEGGKIEFGGKVPDNMPEKGAFYEPTLISGLKPDARVSVEEIFGPVVTIYRFSDDEEVLKHVNLVKYGLCTSIITKSLRRAHYMAANIDVGIVWVNNWLLRDLRTPFGGVKESGVGREGGKYSLEFYSEEKNVCIDLSLS